MPSFPLTELYNPKAFFAHAALLRQAFAHCAKFPTAASRRSLDRVSVPVWLIILSDQLPVVALVSRYLTNKLIGRGPISRRRPKLPFGRPACATFGLALLALHTGAPVLPFFTRREPNGKYILEIGPKVEIIHSTDRNNDILLNTQNFTKIIEEKIRQSPEQWFWVHQRWKTKLCQAKKRG